MPTIEIFGSSAPKSQATKHVFQEVTELENGRSKFRKAGEDVLEVDAPCE